MLFTRNEFLGGNKKYGEIFMNSAVLAIFEMKHWTDDRLNLHCALWICIYVICIFKGT